MLPLPSLLSHMLAAFTIELDNTFEQRMPNHTKATGSANAGAGLTTWGYAPWCASWVMYANFLRYVDDAGTPVRAVQRAARITDGALQVCLSGMSRWGYVRVTPDPDDKRPKPPKKDWLVRPTAPGVRAREVWAPLPAEIEGRWAERHGAGAMTTLKARLAEIDARLDRGLPEYLPIARWGMLAETPKPDSGERADAGDLSAAVSRVLLAFTLDYERDGGVSLMVAANVLRVLNAEGGAVRDLPALSGVSKEAIAMAFSVLAKLGCIETLTDAARTRLVRLTERGLAAKAAHASRLEAVEGAWRERLGGEAIDGLRAALEALVGGPDLAASPLAAGLEPPLRGWRARFPRPRTLPHHPAILHRGGYPDGA